MWIADESLTFMASFAVSSQPRGQPPALSTTRPLASLQVITFAFQMLADTRPPAELHNPMSAHISFYDLKKERKKKKPTSETNLTLKPVMA